MPRQKEEQAWGPEGDGVLQRPSRSQEDLGRRGPGSSLDGGGVSHGSLLPTVHPPQPSGPATPGEKSSTFKWSFEYFKDQTLELLKWALGPWDNQSKSPSFSCTLPRGLGVPRQSCSATGRWLDSPVQQLAQRQGLGRGKALTPGSGQGCSDHTSEKGASVRFSSWVSAAWGSSSAHRV